MKTSIYDNKQSQFKNIFKNIQFYLNEKNCPHIVDSKWRNDHDYNCSFQSGTFDKLQIESIQGYINNNLSVYREYVEGIKEPMNLLVDNEESNTLQFLFNDYAFMTIKLSSRFIVESSELDDDSMQRAFKYKDVHLTKNFSSRLEYLIANIKRNIVFIYKQCEVMNEAACKAVIKLRKVTKYANQSFTNL